MKTIAFTVADKNNLVYAKKMINSFHKFHPDIPVEIIGPAELEQIKHPAKFYIMTPLIARSLIPKYDLVLKLDADQVITGPLDHVIDDATYDLGCVLNWNRVDPQRYDFPLTVWDIPDRDYMNCGFVAMRSQEMIEHWWDLCMRPNLQRYRFAEQDLLNIIYHYGNYNVKCFDHSDKWHGLVSKGEWNKMVIKKDKLILPVTDDYPDEEKEIKVLHWAGGQVPHKMNFKAEFSPEVAKHLESLVKDKNE